MKTLSYDHVYNILVLDVSYCVIDQEEEDSIVKPCGTSLDKPLIVRNFNDTKQAVLYW